MDSDRNDQWYVNLKNISKDYVMVIVHSTCPSAAGDTTGDTTGGSCNTAMSLWGGDEKKLNMCCPNGCMIMTLFLDGKKKVWTGVVPTNTDTPITINNIDVGTTEVRYEDMIIPECPECIGGVDGKCSIRESKWYISYRYELVAISTIVILLIVLAIVRRKMRSAT